MDDFEDDEEPVSCIGGKGLRVQTEMCSTCIFRPGNLMSLNSGRLKDMVDSVKAGDSYVICHQTLSDPLGSVCKGSFDNIYTTPVQIAERLNAIEWTTPKGESETLQP